MGKHDDLHHNSTIKQLLKTQCHEKLNISQRSQAGSLETFYDDNNFYKDIWNNCDTSYT